MTDLTYKPTEPSHRDKLIIFWEECLARRKAQFQAHQDTLVELQVVYELSSKTFVADVILKQQEWLDDARRKIIHAENVLHMLKEKI
jgi:hypothetical protein